MEYETLTSEEIEKIIRGEGLSKPTKDEAREEAQKSSETGETV